MKPGRTLFSCAVHREATAVALTCDDGRPAGWTEALALAFIAEGFTAEPEAFANAFVHGDWRALLEEWPEFMNFVRSRS